MGGADHGPLASDLVEPSEEELSEASALLDLTEYRLGGLFSQPISATSPGCGIGLAMPDATRREIGPDAALCHGDQIGFGRAVSVHMRSPKQL